MKNNIDGFINTSSFTKHFSRGIFTLFFHHFQKKCFHAVAVAIATAERWHIVIKASSLIHDAPHIFCSHFVVFFSFLFFIFNLVLIYLVAFILICLMPFLFFHPALIICNAPFQTYKWAVDIDRPNRTTFNEHKMKVNENLYALCDMSMICIVFTRST